MKHRKICSYKCELFIPFNLRRYKEEKEQSESSQTSELYKFTNLLYMYWIRFDFFLIVEFLMFNRQIKKCLKKLVISLIVIKSINISNKLLIIVITLF